MRKKIGISLVLSFLILILSCFSVNAIYYGFEEKIDNAMEYINTHHKEDSTADMWSLLCVLAANKQDNPEYSFMVPKIKSADFDDNSTDTDLAKAIISLKVMGKDPTDLDGMDLTSMLINRQKDNGAFSDNPTANTHVFNIIALELAEADYDKQKAIDYLVSLRKQDGGYTYDTTAEVGNVDTSAMALAALSFSEYGKSKASPTIEYLKSVKASDGNFIGKGEYDSANSCSQSLAIMGLYLIGEDLFDSTWTNASTALMSYQTSNGGFAYQKDDQPDYFSTHQAIPALYALNKAFDNTPSDQPRILSTPKTGDEGIHPMIIVFAIISILAIVACAIVPIIKKKNNKK